MKTLGGGGRLAILKAIEVEFIPQSVENLSRVREIGFKSEYV